ncbi:MAG TPA: Fic family protein [Actinomycetota bacterium]|nr:Fic family protein [Actinomycetota bacterium]
MPSDRAGQHERQVGGFSAFIPRPLPPADLDVGPRLQALVSNADLALGRLDGAVDVVPHPDQFVLMYVRREAVLSSQIEGTHASLMDVLEYEAIRERGEARMDVREIVNYIAAMRHGLSRLSVLPVSRRLMCEVHEILMRNVRGGEPHKTPGEFRRSQNWIGGASPATARFVPPPADLVGEAFAALEDFLHATDPMPPLIKAGLAHAQFETIHPFLDGNGRTGRLLITFWLIERGVLKKPLLYPSLFFKEHRDEYIDRLQAIRDDGAWEEWLAFFLDGIAHVAAEATDRALEIVALRERDRERVLVSLGRRAHTGLRLFEQLLEHPVVTASSVMEMIDVSSPTANALVRDFERIGILKEMTGRQRRRVFTYQDYLDVFPDAAARR